MAQATALLIAISQSAPSQTWEPSHGHRQIPIWPGRPPHDQPLAGPETSTTAGNFVAGKPWTSVGRVSNPTITVYPPKGRNTGAAVIVFPGGGYTILAIDLEGTEICDWLTTRGVTCVLLKYRVPGGSYYRRPAYPKSGSYPHSPIALDDAQRAIGLVRFHAKQWHIDPHRIGVLGFSAGGHLVAATSTHSKRIYRPVDAADRVSCRPDFGIALYPGHLWLDTMPRTLNPDIRVTRQTPPTFLLQAKDDPVDSVRNSEVYYAALKEVGVPVEYHLFDRGGHAFGMRRTKLPITAWPNLVELWLSKIGMIRN